MDLTLTNFEQLIDNKILKRGRQYHRTGQVIQLKENPKGAWSARVEGTDIYEVSIRQGAQGDLACECDCPYDWGPICKHIAAVLYAISEKPSEADQNRSHNQAKKRRAAAETIVDILQTLEYEDLVSLLAELADDDRHIANLLRARFGNQGNDKKAFTRLVKNALRLGQDRHGFIDYYGSSRAAQGVFEILERADSELSQGMVRNAIPAYQAVLEVLVPAIGKADDSNGELGDCVNSSLEGLSQAAQLGSTAEKQGLFAYCRAAALDDRFVGWGWRWDLAQIAADLVTNTEQREQLNQLLEQMVNSRHYEGTASDWLSQNDLERADKIRFSIINRLDDDQEQRAFLQAHVAVEAFRDLLVRRHIQHGELAEAQLLCTQWLTQSATRPRGYRLIFLNHLLEIARLENQDNNYIQLAQELFLSSGDFNYYDMLKQKFSAEQWPAVRDQLILQARQNLLYNELLPQIFVEEAMWLQLLQALQQSGRYTVEYYRKHLEKRFPAEMSAIYERIVWELMTEKANRAGYREAGKYIRRMKNLGQLELAETLITALRTKYKQRSALLDELGKV